MIDDREDQFPLEEALIQKITHRRFGVGADGLILLHQEKDAPFVMRIFNPDGKEAEMCGNGLRCLVHFIHHLTQKKSFAVKTKSGFRQGRILDKNAVSIDFGAPKILSLGKKMCIESKQYTCDLIDTGVPHAIFFEEEMPLPFFLSVAKKLRFHEAFLPSGANINLIDEKQGTLKLRTFERGLEEETWACGTGAAAACISFLERKKQTVKNVSYKSLETHAVTWNIENGAVINLFITGSVFPVFRGMNLSHY